MKTIRYDTIKYHPRWQKGGYGYFKNGERRSGRTTILIMKAILELLEDGECIVGDHYHSNHTTSFFSGYMINEVFDTLFGLLHLDRKEVLKKFDFRLIMEDQYCLGIYIRAYEKQYQYK